MQWGTKEKGKNLYFTIKPQNAMAQAVLWCYGFVNRTQHTVSSPGIGNECQMPVQMLILHTYHICLCV